MVPKNPATIRKAKLSLTLSVYEYVIVYVFSVSLRAHELNISDLTQLHLPGPLPPERFDM